MKKTRLLKSLSKGHVIQLINQATKPPDWKNRIIESIKATGKKIFDVTVGIDDHPLSISFVVHNAILKDAPDDSYENIDFRIVLVYSDADIVHDWLFNE